MTSYLVTVTAEIPSPYDTFEVIATTEDEATRLAEIELKNMMGVLIDVLEVEVDSIEAD